MDASEVKKLLSDLTQRKSDLEADIAVSRSKIETAQEKVTESEAKVLEIVGSVEPEAVKDYLVNLEAEIEKDLAQLNKKET